MQKQNIVGPTAGSTAAETPLWIVEDGLALPYKHIVDGMCECKTCSGKITHIILPYAA